jgi:CheY-like chemotaxis protein
MVAPNKISRVCIVEDDMISAFALKEILVSKGIEEKNITVIDNGEEAVRNITHNFYDLILLDCKLKGEMDGIKVSQLLKEHGNIKIIGMTASIETDQKAKWLCCLDGILIKPFSSNSVIKMLNL